MLKDILHVGNLDGYFAFQSTCMLPFWNNLDLRKPFRGNPNPLDHHQEDQEAQGLCK